jgi:hypothetical protein
MDNMIWSPDSQGVPSRQNIRLWKDMERAYQFVESYARYSISGDLEGFLFELVRRRWNLACADVFEQPPARTGKYRLLSHAEALQTAPKGLSLVSVDTLSLSETFCGGFKEFAENERHAGKEEVAGKLYGYGTDGYGTYIPLHLVWPEWKEYWGIYISEHGLLSLAASLYKYMAHAAGSQIRLFPDEEVEKKQIGHLIQIAYQVILRHQLFHFKIEQWALLFELAAGRAFYLPYLQDVYLPTIYDPQNNNLEEAIANLSILLSKKIKKIEAEGGLSVAGFLEIDFLGRQGPSYCNFRLQEGVPDDIEKHNREERYREVVNYLCNQIIRHELQPERPLIPYYLYPPNNNFLRAEDLCPIYLIRNLPYEASVIS